MSKRPAAKNLLLFLVPFFLYYWMKLEGFSKEDALIPFIISMFIILSVLYVNYITNKNM